MIPKGRVNLSARTGPFPVRQAAGASTQSGTAGDSSSESTFPILAVLKSVMFEKNVNADGDNVATPRFHWAEASYDISTGDVVEVAASLGGESSKNVARCATLSKTGGSAGYSEFTTPAAAADIPSPYSISNAGGQLKIAFDLAWSAYDAGGSPVTYRVKIGNGLGPAARAIYGDSGEISDTEFTTPESLPLDGQTVIYLRLITRVSGADVNENIYQATFDLAGDGLQWVSVIPRNINLSASLKLVSPKGNTAVAITDSAADITFGCVLGKHSSGAEYAGAELYCGTGTGDPVAGDADTYDLGYASIVGGAATVEGLPADGTVFYVSVLGYLAGGVNWEFNRYKVSILPKADRRAVFIEAMQNAGVENLAGFPVGVGVVDGEETDETELPVPVPVVLFKLQAEQGDLFVCSPLQVEFVGEIVAESSGGADDDFTDSRYWVKPIKVANADPDNAAGDLLAFADAAHAGAAIVAAENLAESDAGSHNLAVGTRVMVRAVRGGDKPWIARYLFNSGGTGGGARFLAKIQSAGPSSESDYSDARYWVQEVDDTTSAETGPLSLATVPVASGGRWVTAHHVTELGVGTSDAGGHYIRQAVTGIVVPDRYVIVEEIKLTTGVKYVFNSYLGQIQENEFAARVTCLDADGCATPTWFKMVGTAYVDQADPPDC